MLSIVLGAKKEPVAVEIVGDNWWHNLISPVPLAVAAILAAAIAAYVAIHNHKRQLEHDQAERDREHARDAIRAASETIAAIIDPLTAYELMVRNDDNAVKEMAALDDSEDQPKKETVERRASESAKKVREARQKTEPVVIKTMVDSIGLRISFGANSPVFETYRDLSLTFSHLFKASAPTAEARAKREISGEDESSKKIHEALEAFQEACEEWSVRQPSESRRRWFNKGR